jgi:hypothetical protein
MKGTARYINGETPREGTFLSKPNYPNGGCTRRQLYGARTISPACFLVPLGSAFPSCRDELSILHGTPSSVLKYRARYAAQSDEHLPDEVCGPESFTLQTVALTQPLLPGTALMSGKGNAIPSLPYKATSEDGMLLNLIKMSVVGCKFWRRSG